MSIGDKVRATRKAAGISQEEVARRAGVSLNVINRLERGVILDPHYSTLRGIASALGVPVEDLVREHALAGEAEAPKVGRYEPGDVIVSRSAAEGHLTIRSTLEELEENRVREILEGIVDGRITVEEARQLVKGKKQARFPSEAGV